MRSWVVNGDEPHFSHIESLKFRAHSLRFMSLRSVIKGGNLLPYLSSKGKNVEDMGLNDFGDILALVKG